jgi:hypothetical protein
MMFILKDKWNFFSITLCYNNVDDYDFLIIYIFSAIKDVVRLNTFKIIYKDKMKI